MKIDELIRALKEAAQKATPGPWYVVDTSFYDENDEETYLWRETDKWEQGTHTVSPEQDKSGWTTDCGHSGYGITKENAELMALANPQNILALCEYIERLDSSLQYLTGRFKEGET